MIILVTAIVTLLVVAGVFKTKMDAASAKGRRFKSRPTGDEPNEVSQITSVPEKQIEDIEK
jgi:hypothetical protein